MINDGGMGVAEIRALHDVAMEGNVTVAANQLSLAWPVITSQVQAQEIMP
ncbi:MAG: hypothetical protein ACR2RA_19440 [Geminicoccaceae bacterium]